MAKFTVLGSGSSGNCYILECEDSTLVLEIGLSWPRIIEGLEYNLDRKLFAIATHEHGDHINQSGLEGCFKFQIPVFSTPSAAWRHNSIKPLQNKTRYRMGGFLVTPLKVPHGDTECFAYFIYHEEIGITLFATDLSSFPYRIAGPNHIFIECNHSEEVILENISEGYFTSSRFCDHFSLEKCTETIARLSSDKLMDVTLLHLSARNSDPAMFSKRILEETGFLPRIATSGMSFEITNSEF